MVKRKRISRVPKEIRAQLINCIEDLINDSSLYDQGNFKAIKRSSTVLRMLFYDSNTSHSITKQIDSKDKLRFIVSNPPIKANEIVYYGSIFVARFKLPGLSNSNYYDTYLFDKDFHNLNREINFNLWWNEPILRVFSTEITRGSLIRIIANQDGGAHFDPKIDSNYVNIVNGKTGFKILGAYSDLLILGTPEKSNKDLLFYDAHLALMRQIVHETIISLIKTYSLPLTYSPDFEYNRNRKTNIISFQLQAIDTLN